MNQPIRSVDDLVSALRGAQIERELSDAQFERIMGMAHGSVTKYLGPTKVKGLGSMSLPLLLGGLGKALVLVDDEDQINRVKSRWERRNIVGGSAIQMRASCGALKREDTSVKLEQNEDLARMQILGRMGGIKSGKTRRAKAERRKAIQRIRSHAARTRWAKAKA